MGDGILLLKTFSPKLYLFKTLIAVKHVVVLDVVFSVGLNEAFHIDFWLAILAEYLATLFLLFAVSGSSLRWEGAPTIFQQALAAGLSTASAIQAFRSISLPLVHGNPAVSLAAFITGDASLVRVTCSIFAQMFGGRLNDKCDFICLMHIKHYFSNLFWVFIGKNSYESKFYY